MEETETILSETATPEVLPEKAEPKEEAFPQDETPSSQEVAVRETEKATTSPTEDEAAGDREVWTELLEIPEHAYCCMEYGDILEGYLMHIDEEEILVDVGAKAEGVVPHREFRKAQQAGELDALSIGDKVYVYVLRAEDEDGRAILSIDRARLEKSWRWLEQIHQEGTVIEAAVDGHNKGGLLVNLQGVRGFIPASQVSSMSPNSLDNRQDSLAQMIGQTLPLKVIEINRRRNRLILSERQAARDHRESCKDELLKSLETGQIYQGTVSSVCSFGVFVDLGGADGLIHLSELSWGHVEHPREVVQAGEKIEVYVLGVDQERKRIALSLRRTQPEPWSTVGERYHLGQVIQGEISQLTSFGAFARLEEGIEGLIHLSELSDTPITHPREVVQKGDSVSLRIIRIDPVHRRIGLSLRRALHDMGDQNMGEETQESVRGVEDVEAED